RVRLSGWWVREFNHLSRTVTSDIAEWTEQELASFTQSYIDGHPAEMRALRQRFSTRDFDPGPALERDLQPWVTEEWNGSGFNICTSDCRNNTDLCTYTLTSHATHPLWKSVTLRATNASVGDEEQAPFTVQVDLSVVIEYEGWVYFELVCGCVFDEELVSKRSGDSIPLVDLVDFTKKPGMIVPVYTVNKGFPWLPVGGGIIAGGVVTYLVTRDGNPPTSALIVNPDNVTIPCNGSATIDVLQNDRGDELEVINIAPVSGASVTQGPGGRITISDLTVTAPFTFIVTVGDAHGQTAQNPVNVTVTVPPILVLNDDFETPFGTPLSGNLLDNDQGDLVVTSNTQPDNGTVTVGSDGTFTFIPADDLKGTAMFGYNVSGPCGQTGIGLVTIEVLPPDCAFSVSISTTPANCGMEDGSATLTVDPARNYSYSWSNGGDSAMEVLGAGTYTVTITSPDGNCTEEIQVMIEELPPPFDATFTTTAANCNADDGSATIEVTPGGAYTYQWSTGGTGQTEMLGGGSYTVTVTDSNGCSKSFEVTIEELPPAFESSFNTNPATCGIADGSVTAVPEPDGSYTYLWSNGASGATVKGIMANTYTVTITDVNGCSKEFNLAVPKSPASYIGGPTIIDGDCNTADIVFDLETPGAGPLQVEAIGPNGAHVFTTPPGEVSLSAFINVVPGLWSLVITDQSIGDHCADSIDLFIDEIISLNAQDDAYDTTVDEPVSGNVLDNDAGSGLQVIDYTQPAGGELSVNPDGQFVFTPPAGETGQFSFQYTVRDKCLNEQIRTVTITVNALDCLFEVTFETTPAHCGLSDGAISTTPLPEGTYTYEWSQGSTTADLNNIPAGTYDVTVTSVDLNCDHVYSITVSETPNTYISDLQTTPGNCIGGGSIALTLSTPGNGPLIVEITGPEGMSTETLPAGAQSFEDLSAGTYLLNVYDQGAGSTCNETAEVTIEDNTIPPEAIDDSYDTPFNTPVSGNVLDNDTGLNLQLTSVSNIFGGMVIHQSNGSFTFTPDDGYTGEAGFDYLATDTCGMTVTAHVLINVMPGVCDFTPEFFVTNASCGLSDGIIDVDILE
ncbi:MAG: Ig-like domain-containing protein, partial [Saprospiraceae bacterium]|nr:Ig-like domain-containing protein [Saprospiraceae bacterium]